MAGSNKLKKPSKLPLSLTHHQLIHVPLFFDCDSRLADVSSSDLIFLFQGQCSSEAGGLFWTQSSSYVFLHWNSYQVSSLSSSHEGTLFPGIQVRKSVFFLFLWKWFLLKLKLNSLNSALSTLSLSHNSANSKILIIWFVLHSLSALLLYINFLSDTLATLHSNHLALV